MAENFPGNTSEIGEEERNNKLSRIQNMLARLLRLERHQDSDTTEITEDDISARSAIQFTASSAIFATQTDEEE
jgi:hypothetical protein